MPGDIAAIFIALCQEHLALAVRISAGFMGGWEWWQERLQAGEGGRACTRVLGLPVLLILLPPAAAWPHPRSALGSLCFGVFPFAPCAVD